MTVKMTYTINGAQYVLYANTHEQARTMLAAIQRQHKSKTVLIVKTELIVD